MQPLLRSLHHVTATVTDAQEDVDFYTGLLGLRLVKRTVNFDNHDVYHFYYGNERGTPGTLMTTFPYKGQGVPPGTHGAGQVTVTGFSVPESALTFWKRRLEPLGVRIEDRPPVLGEEAVRVHDPSGLVLDLVATRDDPRIPWTTSTTPAEHAIRGLHGVTLSVRDPGPSVAFMIELLGLRVVDETEGCTRLGVGGAGAGHIVDVTKSIEGHRGRNGLGTVHHVAFAVADGEEQLRMREELVRYGLEVTEVRDRQYFRSIYFREPGGVLFEIATLPPGFTVDEDLRHLGRGLKLPPWEEPNRAQIEQMLPRVVT